MSEAIVIAVIGLCGGVLTATIALIQNRLNRKDTVQDQDRIDLVTTLKDLNDRMSHIESTLSNNQRMAVLSVGDKLRHYGNKYLGNPDVNYIDAVKDWLSLEESYEANGGNHHIQKMRPMMEELLIQLETLKAKGDTDMGCGGKKGGGKRK